MVFTEEDYKSVAIVPIVVTMASGIIIFITTWLNDENAVRSLIGGYLGLGLGILFTGMLKYPPKYWMDLIPFIMLLGIVWMMIYYLYLYFDIIVKGHVSNYYRSFSILSIMFLAVQVITLFSALFKKPSETELPEKWLSSKTFSLLTLFGVINYIIVITIGIVLKFYSTQG